MEYAKDSKERIPYEHYLQAYQNADPKVMSERTGIPYQEEQKLFQIEFMGTTYQVSYPEFAVTHEEDSLSFHILEDLQAAKTFMIRFLVEGHSAQTTGKFLTYREMPWGEVYFKQFQGRCLMRLAFGFGNRLKAFSEAMEVLGAKKLSMGDCSYELEFLKGMYLQFILWEGDEEFPPSSQILFSDNFASCFSAEDRAVIGDITIGAIKALSSK